MGDVVDLNARLAARDSKPGEHSDWYTHGAARCLACGHLWQAVASVGTAELECPSCHSTRGVWDAFVRRAGPTWHCILCNSDLFRICPDETHCASCGYVGVYSSSGSPWPPVLRADGELDIQVLPIDTPPGDNAA